MSDQDKPFWQGPMRVMDLALEDSHGSWLNRWTPEQIVETAVQLSANVLNMLVVNEWGQAYWPSPHLPMHPELKGEDRLGAVVERARRAGLHVSAMWGPTAAPCQSERHPDWASRSRDGKKLGWGLRKDEKCFMLCMNSPYEDLVNDVVDQLFRDYEVELLALDFYHQEPCWCEHCRQRCLADTRFDIFSERPPYGRENIHREWHEQRVNQQLLRLSQTVKKHGGALVHYRVAAGVDVIFHEPHTGDMLDLRDKGFMVRRDKADGRATGKSSVICTPSSHHYYIGWSKPAAHMRQEFRVIGIHGSNPWAVMWDWEILRDPRGLEPLGAVFREMKSTAPLMAEARPLRHVALMFSRKNPTSGGDHAIEEHGDAVKGFYDALSRAHIPFEVIRDDLITADELEGYSTLILPNVGALSDEKSEAVKSFVSRGGRVVSTFRTSLYTAEGWNRHEFALGEVFGVRYLAEFEAPWCYVTPQGSHPILAHIGGGMGIPHGDIWHLMRGLSENGQGLSAIDEIKAGKATDTGRHLKVDVVAGAQVIANVHDTRKPLGTYFIKDIVPPIPGKDTGYPAIVVHQFGEGLSVYFAGQPDRLFHRQGHPDYEELLVNTVRWVADEPDVSVEAPNTIEATYWRLDNGHLIHLLNHTYDAMFPAPASCVKVPASREVFRPVRKVIPVYDVKIHFRSEPDSVEVLVGDSRVIVEGSVARLDRLNEYAVVRIK